MEANKLEKIAEMEKAGVIKTVRKEK